MGRSFGIILGAMAAFGLFLATGKPGECQGRTTPETITVTVSSNNIALGDTVTGTASATDSGVALTVSPSDAESPISGTSPVSFSFTPTASGTLTVTAACAVGSDYTGSGTATIAVSGPSLSAFPTGSPSVPRDRASQTAVTFVLLDGSGNPIAGHVISYTASGGITVSPSGSQTTDGSGTITVEVASSDVSGSDGGGTIAATAAVSPAAPVSVSVSVITSGLNLSISPNPTTTTEIFFQPVATLGNIVSLKCSAKDNAGQPSQVSINLSDSLGASLSKTSGATDINGNLFANLQTGSVFYATGQTDVVTATISGTSISNSTAITFDYPHGFTGSVANVTTPGQAVLFWSLLGTDGNDFPGAGTNIQWNLPGLAAANVATASPASGQSTLYSAPIAKVSNTATASVQGWLSPGSTYITGYTTYFDCLP